MKTYYNPDLDIISNRYPIKLPDIVINEKSHSRKADYATWNIWMSRDNPDNEVAKFGYFPIEQRLTSRPSQMTEYATTSLSEVKEDINGYYQETVWTDISVEGYRDIRISQLHDWWDNYIGIEVVTDVVLPIQEQARNTNEAQVVLWLVMYSQTAPTTPLEVVDVNDYTVEIAGSEVLTALSKFKTDFKIISQKWDTTHKAIMASETIQELKDIVI